MKNRTRRARAVLRLARMKTRQVARRALGGAIWGAGLCWWCCGAVVYSGYAIFLATGALLLSTAVAVWCVMWSGE